MLDHRFIDYIGLGEGLSENVMDYPSGIELWKFQWDRIHDPGNVWGLFQRDEDALALLIDNITGAVLGAVIEVSIQVSTNVYEKYYNGNTTQNIWEINWWPDVTISAASGFVSSGVGSSLRFASFLNSTIGKIAVEVSTDFLIGVAEDAAKKYLNNEEISWTSSILENVISSAAFGTLNNTGIFNKIKEKIKASSGKPVILPELKPTYSPELKAAAYSAVDKITTKTAAKATVKYKKTITQPDVLNKVLVVNKVPTTLAPISTVTNEVHLAPLNRESAEEIANELKSEIKEKTVTSTTKDIDDEFELKVNTAGNLTSLLAKWDNLTIAEAKNLYTQLVKTEIKGSKTAVTQSSILAEINASNSLVNPYSFAHSIDDIVLTQEALFVRVHNPWNPNRPWLISIEEFKTFTSQDDMIKKLALPILDNTGNVVKPSEISIVKLPVGTKVRQSLARPQDWPGQAHQPGGAGQFEIRENPAIPKGWFKPMGNVSDYLN